MVYLGIGMVADGQSSRRLHLIPYPSLDLRQTQPFSYRDRGNRHSSKRLATPATAQTLNGGCGTACGSWLRSWVADSYPLLGSRTAPFASGIGHGLWSQ